MPNMQCTDCKYRFDIRDGKPLPKRCPYCASEGSVRRSKLMQEWIDDVEHATSDFING